MVRSSLLFLILYIPFSVGYGQTQETKEKFQFKEWQFLYEEKCLVCHESGRILLERKSRKDWEKCVADMRIQVRQDFKKDWFTKDEFNLIVDLLVKTQGIKGNEE